MAVRELPITPAARPLNASIRPPGSKSITNRAMLLAAMAPGTSRIAGALASDDTQVMAAALHALGFALTLDHPAGMIVVNGRGGEIPSHEADLNAGDAGTAMRFLAGFLTLGRGRYRLDGSERMRQRPIRALLAALRQLGLEAAGERGDDCPPIIIRPRADRFPGGRATIDATLSSQFVSALLMPAPLWRDGLELEVIGDTARPFVTMTLALMERWGARSAVKGDGRIVVGGGQAYQARDFAVEPDATAASYFAAAAALVGGAVRIRDLRRDSVQGDLAFLDLLQQMGADVRWRSDAVEVVGTGNLRGIDATMSDIPDTVPTLAAIAPFASSPTRIRGVGFIRHHESDRLHALATELRRIGAAVEEFEDGLGIAPSHLQPATIATYNDHRLAMAFAVAGLKLAGIRIANPGCVSKTYPDFFRDLNAI